MHRNLDHGYGYHSATQVKKFHCPLFYHLLSAVAFQIESKEEDNSLFVLKSRRSGSNNQVTHSVHDFL